MQPISSSAGRPTTATERRTLSAAAEGDVMSPKNLENSAAEAVQLSPNEIPDSVARHLHKHDHVKYETAHLEPFRK